MSYGNCGQTYFNCDCPDSPINPSQRIVPIPKPKLDVRSTISGNISRGTSVNLLSGVNDPIKLGLSWNFRDQTFLRYNPKYYLFIKRKRRKQARSDKNIFPNLPSTQGWSIAGVSNPSNADGEGTPVISSNQLGGGVTDSISNIEINRRFNQFKVIQNSAEQTVVDLWPNAYICDTRQANNNNPLSPGFQQFGFNESIFPISRADWVKFIKFAGQHLGRGGSFINTQNQMFFQVRIGIEDPQFYDPDNVDPARKINIIYGPDSKFKITPQSVLADNNTLSGEEYYYSWQAVNMD